MAHDNSKSQSNRATMHTYNFPVSLLPLMFEPPLRTAAYWSIRAAGISFAAKKTNSDIDAVAEAFGITKYDEVAEVKRCILESNYTPPFSHISEQLLTRLTCSADPVEVAGIVVLCALRSLAGSKTRVVSTTLERLCSRLPQKCVDEWMLSRRKRGRLFAWLETEGLVSFRKGKQRGLSFVLGNKKYDETKRPGANPIPSQSPQKDIYDLSFEWLSDTRFARWRIGLCSRYGTNEKHLLDSARNILHEWRTEKISIQNKADGARRAYNEYLERIKNAGRIRLSNIQCENIEFDEWIRPDGERTYGDEGVEVPINAPLRPSASHYWNGVDWEDELAF